MEGEPVYHLVPAGRALEAAGGFCVCPAQAMAEAEARCDAEAQPGRPWAGSGLLQHPVHCPPERAPGPCHFPRSRAAKLFSFQEEKGVKGSSGEPTTTLNEMRCEGICLRRKSVREGRQNNTFLRKIIKEHLF